MIRTNQFVKPKDRILILGEDVNQASVKELIKSIYDINLDDEEKEQTYQEYDRTPIHLVLNTFGGSVYDGLGLIGAIELSTTPVVVTCLGSAMSMGLYILASGHYRRAHHLSTVMYHEMAIGAWDKLEGIKKDMAEAARIEEMCDGILFKRTLLKPKDLFLHKQRKGDWYFSAADALKFGIIDEIIGAPLMSKENAERLVKNNGNFKNVKLPIVTPKKKSAKTTKKTTKK